LLTASNLPFFRGKSILFVDFSFFVVYGKSVKTLKNNQRASEENTSPAVSVKLSYSGRKGRALTGKIARLPEAIRTELNERLFENTESSYEIVQWLNSLEPVQKVLKKHFHGQAITEDNLSRWRQGPFLNWLQERATLRTVSALAAASAGMKVDELEDLNKKLSIVLSARLAAELLRYDFMDEGESKSAAWRDLVTSFLALRRADFYGTKVEEERKKAALELEQMREREAATRPLSEEEKEDRINQIMGAGRFECNWDNQKKIWVGPGAAMRYEEEEVTRQVREEMERRYPNGFPAGYRPPY
jgi:hypothetical protein